MKKVLIFGVSGFVGNYLSREFINNGYKVVGSDKIKGTMLDPEVEFFEADLMQSDSIENIIVKI